MPASDARKHRRSALIIATLAGLLMSMGGCAMKSPTKPPMTDVVAEAFAKSAEARSTAQATAAANVANENLDMVTGQIADSIPYEGFEFSTDTIGSQYLLSDKFDNAPSVDEEQNIPTVSGEWVETPLREVFEEIQGVTGVDIQFDDKVNGVVNMTIEDLSIDDAIEKLLLPHPFYHKRVGNTVYIAPAETGPMFGKISKRYQYRTRFLETDALITTVPTEQSSFVKKIEGTNIILVEAPPRIAVPILERFADVDKPLPQVFIETLFCVVSPDSGHQLGLDWKHAVELNGDTAFSFSATGLGLGLNLTNQGASEAFSDFSKTTAFVNALKENGFLTIQATPSVVAQHGKQATMSIQRQTFFSVQPATANGDSNSFFFQQNIQEVQSGIELDVTPYIHNDLISINIDKAEVSEDVRSANADAALNPFPIITRRNISTSAAVRSGRTIVIGGLVQRETVDRESFVPGLGKVPGVGRLFRSTQRQTRDAEIVIFLSPKLMPHPAESQFCY